MRVSNLTAGLVLSITALGFTASPAMAERIGGSTASEFSVALSAVPVLSLWLSGYMVEGSVKEMSRTPPAAKLAQEQPRWKVTSLTVDGDNVRTRFTSLDEKQVLEVPVPAAVIREANLAVNDDVRMQSIGKSSAVLSRAGKPLVVLADPGSNLVRSVKK